VTTTNYRTGVRLEYRAIDLLSRRGWYVLRSAGSHGVADLVALSPDDGHAVLVQCKTGRLKHEDWQRLRETAIRYHAVPVIAAWNDTRRRVLWLVITGEHQPGSHDWPAIPLDLGRDRDPVAL
jgi:Holliday junction resolvase